MVAAERVGEGSRAMAMTPNCPRCHNEMRLVDVTRNVHWMMGIRTYLCRCGWLSERWEKG